MKTLIIAISLFLLTATSHANYVNLFDIAANSIKAEHHGRDYDRSHHFGSWRRVDDNCYDTRNFILANYSSKRVVHYSNRPCKVKSGVWNPLYKADKSSIRSPRKLHVDHMVPLKEAFVSGANKWSKPKRCHYNNFLKYANHLILVSATENLRKSDREPGDYMPPNRQIRCEYIKQWMIVKAIWGLTFDRNEISAIQQRFYENNCSSSEFLVDQNGLANMQASTNQPTQSCR